MQTPSIGGSHYLLAFIDEYTRKTWVYFLKQKVKCLSAFANTKLLLRSKVDTTSKSLGLTEVENTSQTTSFDFAWSMEFRSNLQQGIQLSKNGVVERKNRTIMEMARSIMKGKRLPNDYWAEDVACATYILNRCPTKSIQNIVLEEAWSGRMHSVTHMRVFGCVEYAQAPYELRNKLDSKGDKCIFVGYSDESKAYKLYNPLTKKVIINRDVHFIEEEAWDGSLEKEVNVKACIPHEDKEELTTSNNSSTVTPSTPIQVQQSRQRTTPSTNNRTVSRSQESASPSKLQIVAPSDMSSLSSTSIRRPKIRNLNEIYEQEEVDSNAGLNSIFSLFCHVDNLIHFQDAVKEKMGYDNGGRNRRNRKE